MTTDEAAANEIARLLRQQEIDAALIAAKNEMIAELRARIEVLSAIVDEVGQEAMNAAVGAGR